MNATTAENSLSQVQAIVKSCIQCGTCTASCPNAFAMDHTPRMLWKMVLSDRADAVFKSKTFILCSSCYYCTLRCPRGLELTKAMGLLTRMARRFNPEPFKQSHQFYHEFLQSVRRHGRVNEAEFMSYFFWSMKNPALPLKYASLGMKLMKKRKVSLPGFYPWEKDENRLDRIFTKVEEVEERP